MLYEFIEAHRDTLVERCKLEAASSFVGQVIDTLRIDRFSTGSNNRVVSGPWGAVARDMPSEIASAAAKSGSAMLRHGFTVAQVVDAYGDLCRAVMELAIAEGVSISPREFLMLNRCLDVAIAHAVTEFGRQRDRLDGTAADPAIGERLGHLAHDLRSRVNAAMLAYKAIKDGGVGVGGATSAVLESNLAGLRECIDLSLADIRLAAGTAASLEDVDLDAFIAEFQVAARVEAAANGGKLNVTCERELVVHVDKQMLLSALSNLLRNAFRATGPATVVGLEARGNGERVLIEVEDRCGVPAADRSATALGLSIARRAMEASAGSLRVRDEGGLGCVCTIDLPRMRRSTDTPARVA